MGSFFTSTQIYNPNLLDREKFINFFCEEMKKNSYVTSNSDESEVSYILRFSDGCKWVTITSEAYEQGNQLSQSDTGGIAKMLKTICINTTIIDGDCATLDLYDKSGKKKDSLIMGRADDYFGDDIPEPKESVWTLLLEKGYSQKQLLDVRNGDYVFVEEVLSEIAPIIGMDSEGILFSADSFSGDNHTVSLHFEKTAANKEKKLTLNAAFDMVFGEALKPLGFKRPKLRQQYYIRLIDDEILHIIGIRDMKTHLSVFDGIATVYRETLCLDRPFRQNEDWLKSAMHFYVKWHASNQPLDPQIKSGFIYRREAECDSLLEANKRALDAVITWISPVLNRVRSPKDVLDYDKNTGVVLSLPLQDCIAAAYSDTAIQFLLSDPLTDLEERDATTLKAIAEEDERFHRAPEVALENRIRYERKINESRERLLQFLQDSDMHQKTMAELSKRKVHNTDLLRQYGII